MFFLLCPSALWADLSQEQVAKAKQATALVLLPNSSGSAFCISENGLFITSNHVVAKATPGSVSIVVNPASKDEKKYAAKVVRTFPESDLAVLKVQLDGPMAMLKLGDDAKLFETQLLYAFGYPFGKMLATDEKSLPSVSVNIGRVTSLRKKGDTLDAIQLDAQVNPGNSGGPVLDDQGNVVGVIFGGVRASGVNFATPVSILKKAIEVPVLAVKVPEIPYEKRFEPAEFVISLDAVLPASQQPAISLELTSDGQTRRAEAVKGPDGDYRVSLAPLVKKPAGPQKIQVTLNYATGKIVGLVQDFNLQVGGSAKALSDLRLIERISDKEPAMVDGKAEGLLPELAKLRVEVGSEILTVNAQNVGRIEITPTVRDETPITYKAVLVPAVGSPIAASVEGKIKIASVPEPAVPLPKLEVRPAIGESRTVQLPTAFDDVVAGEEGRVLIFHLKDVKKLAVLDVADLKIRGYINLAEEPALFAAGARYLLVVYPTQNVIQRYSLATLAKEKTISNPFASVSAVVMGYSSPRGALFVTSDKSMSRGTFKIFDTETMAEVPANDTDNTLNRISSSGSDLVVRASADGRTFGVYRTGTSPSGFSIISYRNAQLSAFYEHQSPGILVPNADGSLIFTSGSGVYTPRYVSVIPRDGNFFIPSYHPMYFLSVPTSFSSSSTDKTPKSVGIFVGRSSKPLVYLPEPLAELQDKNSRLYSRGDPMTLDKRVHFYPQWNLLLTLPTTNDKVIARPIDVRKVLKDKDIDYLYVTSAPPLAKMSQPVRFRLEAESKAGGVKFMLHSGPPGLSVSENGTVSWVAPAAAGQETVIVGLKDAGGTEALHTFQIVVTN